MITGIVSADLQAIVRIAVLGANGHLSEFEAVIDTGFNGDLTLPSAAIVELGIPFIGNRQVALADGSRQLVDVYAATVRLNGDEMSAQVDVADTEPLVGMRLIEEYGLHIEVIEGGAVTIELL